MNTGMLRKMFGFISGQPPVDPAQFNDPLASKVEWTPATRGGTNFRTHRFVQTDFSRVEFKATAATKLFSSLFGLVGIGVLISLLANEESLSNITTDIIMPLGLGLVFALLGGFLWYTGTTPLVFDKGIGYFWRGRKGPQDVVEVTSLKKYARLDEIHALQLVSEWVRGNKSSYYSYELNLVLEDARRLTVIDHGNLSKLREDAGKLSAFLGKPVWDAIPR